MITKLNAKHHQKVMEYLKKEPEFNLFIIGDIERYGYDNYFLNIWADINRKGDIQGVLLKYFEYIIFYADGKYNVEGFAKLIRNTDYSEISGKSEIVSQLAKSLNLSKGRHVHFSKLSNYKILTECGSDSKIKKIKFGNINKIVKLYEVIDEFENTSSDNIRNGLRTGRGYCVEIDSQVVAMAKSTSENKTHAMIVGVGTHPNYRKKGLATKCTIKICSELLKENKIPCLFYDNEEAGKIYKRIGFKDIGYWTIYYNK
ncbi:MAG: GNAT family N-acetyltransferase [Romboutsia sp.]|uniref:GNAT family N-acetyltransferase n=1 Tax=Romboutsia sp. TaxID=1965302 RepID=UPI003F2ED285